MRLFKRKLSVKQKEALSRLADGIECGAKLRPQTFERLFGRLDSETYGSCAMGAAWECAVIARGEIIEFEDYLYPSSIEYGDILKTYGVTNSAQMKTIMIEDKEITDQWAGIDDVIYRLNDWLLWSRERIAQFLREVE